MLKEHQAVYTRVLIIADLLLITSAFLLGHYLRNHWGFLLEFESVSRTYPLSKYITLLPYMLAIWMITLAAAGAYQPLRVQNLLVVLLDITRAALMATLLFGSLAYLLKLQYVSRIMVSMVSFFAWSFLCVERVVMFQILRSLRKKGFLTRYLLLIGTGSRAASFIKMVHNHPEWGLKIVGLVDEDPRLKWQTIEGQKVLGLLSDIPHLLEELVIDEVVFVVPRGWLGKIEDSILYCEQLGKRVSIAVDLFNVKFAKAVQREIHHFPLLTFETTSDHLWQLIVKRVLDTVLSAVAIAVLLPFLAIVALLIKFSSGGPILFKQARCGLNGRIFTVYKFRTMVVDAEKKLEALRQHNEMSGPAFKMTNDPRIIKYGKWMRKFSIDELPQLFNILEGNMSFVGPRPPIPAEVKRYEPWQRRRLSMRPGLTCLWQVQGRNKIVKFDEWMKLDLEYIDNWSLWLDLRLFLQTIPIVIFGIGAK
ncbi:MAG TPA: sugar transferase [Verrucomicrobiae bacterium]|nr:sugar transferase [Verrucomicrobiae bacterium]